jgi:prepilin signal peptidase PulO-like enzyme (type II secretory pathway)
MRRVLIADAAALAALFLVRADNVAKFYAFAVYAAARTAYEAHAARALPYWPIEVSRTAASSRRSYWTFLAGIAALVLWHVLTMIQRAAADVALPALEWPALSLQYSGLLVLAAVDDETSLPVHMVGVALFAVGAVANAAALGHATVLRAVEYALLVYGARSVVRVAAVLQWEQLEVVPPLPVRERLRRAAMHAQALMYNGDFRRPDRTLWVFRAGAVAQYAALALFALPMAQSAAWQ